MRCDLLICITKTLKLIVSFFALFFAAIHQNSWNKDCGWPEIRKWNTRTKIQKGERLVCITFHVSLFLSQEKIKFIFTPPRFTQLQLEKEQLYNSVMPTIEGTREKVGLRSTLLRRKLQDLTDSLEKSQAQLFTVLSVPNMDHTVLSEIANKSEVMFSCALSFKTQFCYLFYKRRTEKNVLFVGRFRQKKICHQEHCIQKEWDLEG